MRRALRTSALLGLAVGLALASSGGLQLWRARAVNASVTALLSGRDVAVDSAAPAPLLAARARAMIAHGNLDGAQTIADRLEAGAPPGVRANLLYALANARMRRALGEFKQVPYRVVAPAISLAKADYRQALALDPDNWDARYNYALAASLVRDTEAAQPTAGDEMAHERAAWPDIPGAPNGLP